MRLPILLPIFALLLSALVEPTAGQNRNNRGGQGNSSQEEGPPPLPDDERLLALHRNFVREAELLAAEYERDDEWDRAKAVYFEILKLVPQYPNAQRSLDRIREREAAAERVTITVRADREWQDTGITVIEGKPVTLAAAGSWVFNFRAELGADGIQIPEELREFNLGALVGFIDSGDTENLKPFAVGAGTSFVAERTGRLFLRMWDSDHRDNDGVMRVIIQGTFDK